MKAPILLTVPEVAEQLRVRQNTVRELIAAGLLRAERSGSQPHSPFRIEQAAVDAYRRARQVKPTEAPARREEVYNPLFH